ncbi:MAG: GMC family oxidoreductase [Gemmatimonadota bacterium]
MTLPSYDAIVVGSGMSGGWAAKELAEHGLRTLVLEAGRMITPERDYLMAAPASDFPYRLLNDPKETAEKFAIQRRSVGFGEDTKQFFIDDREHPYTLSEGSQFSWLRSRVLGGRSILWGRQVYRWSDLDFEANLRDGVGVDWPIRYADIAPWYEYVEKFVGISGEALGLSYLPDSHFQPAMQMSCAEEQVKAGLARAYGTTRVMTIGRTAVLTAPLNGRAPCHYCDSCSRGCTTGSYFNSVHATLPAAMKTGRCTIRPFSVVHSVMYNEQTRRATGVRVIDAESKQAIEFKAPLVFLCASSLESARILMNSATRSHPHGLGNSSDQLGRNLMDHIKGSGASGRVEGLDDKTSFGRRPNGIYIPRHHNLDPKKPDPKFIRGFGFQGGATGRGPLWGSAINRPGFGAEFKHAQRGVGGWNFSLGGFAECLPNPENRMQIDPAVKDAWGIPGVRISAKWRDNEIALQREMADSAAEMLEAAGVKNVVANRGAPPPMGQTNHEMGTARMGRSPKSSVLNKWNQLWDVPNVYVTDGAAMASSSCVNPSLTYMALTARAVDHAVRQLKQKKL